MRGSRGVAKAGTGRKHGPGISVDSSFSGGRSRFGCRCVGGTLLAAHVVGVAGVGDGLLLAAIGGAVFAAHVVGIAGVGDRLDLRLDFDG